jgi:16S rRNA processing protein RimM
VTDTGGATLGRVKAVHDHGAGDLLEILVPGARQTVLLPFTRAAVPTVDLAAGRIVADPPEGLFE